mgnify:CR=1 FL=1
MPISSLIVRASQEGVKDVADQIRSLAGTSVSKIEKENIIVLTETDSQDDDKKLWDAIEKIPGVVQCDLIYHNFEDMENNSHD